MKFRPSINHGLSVYANNLNTTNLGQVRNFSTIQWQQRKSLAARSLVTCLYYLHALAPYVTDTVTTGCNNIH